MSRNIKGLYTELAFDDGAALVDESIVREQLPAKAFKKAKSQEEGPTQGFKASNYSVVSCSDCCLLGRFDGIRTVSVP